jgi:hypothetical protein
VQALNLRLDSTLTSIALAMVDAATEQLIHFGTSDLRGRSVRQRTEVPSVQRENQALVAQISANEEFVARIKDFTGVQDRTLGVLKSTPVLQQVARSAALVGRSAVTTSMVVPSAPLSPAPIADDVSSTDSSINEAASTLSIAGVALPHWLLPGTMGALLTALLGWLLMSAGRGRSRQLSVLASDASTSSDRPTHSANAAPFVAESLEGDTGVARVKSPELAAELPASADARAPHDAAASRGTNTVGEGTPESVEDLAEESDWTRTMISRKKPAEETDWTRTMLSRKVADSRSRALRELDTLIAFEQFDEAKALLDTMMLKEPDNPEYLLRHYHVRTHGGVDTSHDDVELLRAMMDGPMSDTMLRVRDSGRGLMPGDLIVR